MLSNLTAALALALAIAPIGCCGLQIARHDAAAAPTLRSGMLMPGKSRTFSSAGEFRFCNEGSAPLRMWFANTLTGAPTDSLLQPGRCAQGIAMMISFQNEGEVPVMLHGFGGLGGRNGLAPGRK
jgi:hypothetical protein